MGNKLLQVINEWLASNKAIIELDEDYQKLLLLFMLSITKDDVDMVNEQPPELKRTAFMFLHLSLVPRIATSAAIIKLGVNPFKISDDSDEAKLVITQIRQTSAALEDQIYELIYKNILSYSIPEVFDGVDVVNYVGALAPIIDDIPEEHIHAILDNIFKHNDVDKVLRTLARVVEPKNTQPAEEENTDANPTTTDVSG